MAHLGRPPGGAVRPRRAQVLHPRSRVLAAGRDLPHRDPRALRLLAVPVHLGGGAAVVRLRLPADRVHRDVPLGRAQDRRRPDGADEARCGAAVRREARQEVRQARHLDRHRAVDRRHLRRLLHAHPRAPARDALRPVRLGDLLGAVLRLRDLRQRGLDARAGVQVHVPVRALPVGDVRQGHDGHHLRHGSGRAARRPRQEGRHQGGGTRRVRRLRHLRAGLPHRHRHPQGAAVRVHRLRGVHRRLRPGDGQDGLPEGPDPLHDRERAGQGPRQQGDVAARVPFPHPALHRAAADHRDRRRRFAVPAQPAQGQRDARPQHARARSRARPGRERLPAAGDEHRRDAAAVHGDGGRAQGTQGHRGRPAAAARCRVVADGAAQPAGADRRRRGRGASSKKGDRDDDGKNKRSHKVEIVVEAIGDPKVARREATSFLFPR